VHATRTALFDACGTPAQSNALHDLRSATEESPADYSVIFSPIAPTELPVRTSAAVVPVPASTATRVVQAHVLPLRTATA